MDGAGEQEIPPGKITVVYDDARHTKQTSYTSDEGQMLSTIQMDEQGLAIATSTNVSGTPAEAMSLEFENDDHGNWTTCRRYVISGPNRKQTGLWTRTITYR